jgi:cytochrome c oxidase cbb3-type subunit 3
VSKLPRAPDDDALAKVITFGIPGTQMPATRMTADENRALVAYVRGLARREAAKIPGDRANGERLFWSKGNCGQCHTVGARGGRFGPDLSGIGSRRGAENLRRSILDPEAEIADSFAVYRRVIAMPDNFLLVRLTAASGREISGARANEDAFTIQIRDQSDHIYSFRKDELRDLVEEWGKSPMPGYRAALLDDEVRDIVAWLVSLREAP